MINNTTNELIELIAGNLIGMIGRGCFNADPNFDWFMISPQGLNGEFKSVLTDEELNQLVEEKDKHNFVCEEFSNKIYAKLHKHKCRIFGAPFIISTHRSKNNLPEITRPVYNVAMSGVCLCFTGFRNKEEMSRLCRLVHHMGGSVKKEFSGQITHLIAHCVYQGLKYKVCLTLTLFITD